MKFLKRLWTTLISWLTSLLPHDVAEPAPPQAPPVTPDEGEPVPPGTPHQPPIYPQPPDAPSPLGPDAKGRIRIPEVEALGGDWATPVWWLAPWVAPQITGDSIAERIARWTIRGNVGCDEHGELGFAPGRGFEAGTIGDPMTVYSRLVPYEYRFGTDRYGRENMVYRSRDHISDKLTRSTRAANGAELAAYLAANPGIKPIPDLPDGPFEEPA